MRHPVIYVHSGWVTSRNDGQRHWVPAARAANLYGLPLSAVRLVSSDRDLLGYVLRPEDRHYYPDSTGRYQP